LPLPEYPETSTSSGLAPGYNAVEGSEQGIDFGFSPVQFLWNQQPVWRVMFAKREFVDAMLRFPFSKTAPKITLEASRCLIALLSRLGEQLHDDCRNPRPGTLFSLSQGGVGCLAIWQWSNSIGSEAVNGRVPVSIS